MTKSKMNVKYWEGGLTKHELIAIETIASAFSSNQSNTNEIPLKGKSFEVLHSMKNQRTEMFPWKGYAGFQITDSRRGGEFDLVIVTHYNVIIIELKHWNGVLTANGDSWFLNEQLMGRSPVSVTREKSFLLQNKIKNSGYSFPSFEGKKFNSPKVEFFIVLTGTATGSDLPQSEKNNVFTLDEFSKIADQSVFSKLFRVHPEANKNLNRDFPVFDKIFSEGQVQPKRKIVDGYEAIDKLFPIDDQDFIYTEYLSRDLNNRNNLALLRTWDFSVPKNIESKTAEGRYQILKNEREILSHIHLMDDELYNSCLRSRTNVNQNEVTEEFHELFELPHDRLRLNEFISKHVINYDENERASLVKIILNNFSSLHEITVAHRDIGDLSLWLSPNMKVSMSNFMTASNESVETIKPTLKHISTGIISFPEDQCPIQENSEISKDIYSLGLVIWLVMQGRRLSPASLEEALRDIPSSDLWYAPVAQKATNPNPLHRFKNARELLDSFSKSQPPIAPIELFDSSMLEPYTSIIVLPKTYLEDESILLDATKEIYRSDQSLVKIWNNAYDDNNSQSIFNCLNFIEQIEKIQSLHFAFIPKILDKGISHKNELYLIQEFNDKPLWSTWSNSDIVLNKKIEVIKELVSNIQTLHDNNINHGNIHPENVVISEQDNKIQILNLIDFSHNSTKVENSQYKPSLIDDATNDVLDNYAVIRMATDLLGLDWDNLTENQENDKYFNSLINAIQKEQNDNSGFISLERFSQALNNLSEESNEKVEILTIKLAANNFRTAIKLLPDNGDLFIYCLSTKNKEQPHLVDITLAGIDSSWLVVFNTEDEIFEDPWNPWKTNGVLPRIRDEHQLTIPVIVRIEPSNYSDFSELSTYLLRHDNFLNICKELVENASKDKVKIETITHQTEKQTTKSSINIPTLWKTILDTETEALPRIEIVDETETDFIEHELIIPYETETELLEQFTFDDDITAIIKDGDNEVFLGKTNVNKLTNSTLRVPYNSRIKPLGIGNSIYLRSRSHGISYYRRKKALQRILDGDAVIPDLISYFDQSKEQPFTEYNRIPTDEELDQYNQYDNGKLIFGLNTAQRKAFKTLINKGPLSLLQGPPGTGKTEFIAAFVHYLFVECKAQNILLVSQSHEAVNTAVERIIKHCDRLNTPIDVVRFSNSESSVSQSLKNVYSRNLIEARRQKFIAELRERVQYIQPSLNLEPEFLNAVLNAELGIKRKAKSARRLLSDIKNSKDEKQTSSLSSSLQALLDQIRQELSDNYSIEVEKVDLYTINEAIDISLNTLYSINPRERHKTNALLELINDFSERLASNPGSYEEFLARTRTLVCGTCVGMGLSHLGLEQIQYDWVIIDEAARSTSSELSIAMQSGKRILLVGDHKQLPPLYQEEHKKAVLSKLGIGRSYELQEEVFKSDFEKGFLSTYGQAVGQTLSIQYRMAEPISQLVSDIFYDQPLRTAERKVPDFYNHGAEALKSTVTWLDTSKNSAAYENEVGTSFVNHEEADQIIAILEELAAAKDFVFQLSSLVSKMTSSENADLTQRTETVHEPAIGIICMYEAQKQLIRRKFNQVVWAPEFRDLIKIDTVDSYQGKENRIIIVSLTRNNKEKKSGFLKTSNRINVALSRAMDRLLIVGSLSMWIDNNSIYPLGKIGSYIQKHKNKHYRILEAKQINSKIKKYGK